MDLHELLTARIALRSRLIPRAPGAAEIIATTLRTRRHSGENSLSDDEIDRFSRQCATRWDKKTGREAFCDWVENEIRKVEEAATLIAADGEN